MGLLLVFGSIGFWTVSLVALIALLIFVENEWAPWSVLTLIAVGLGMYFLGNGEAIVAFLSNPVMVGLLLVGYVAVGVVWSMLKWFWLMKKSRQKLWDYKRAYEEKTPHADGDFATHWDRMEEYRQETYRPALTKNKGKIAHWMAFWPFSLLNSLLFDFIKNAYKRLVNLLYGVFKSIQDRVYRDLDAELGSTETDPSAQTAKRAK